MNRAHPDIWAGRGNCGFLAQGGRSCQTQMQNYLPDSKLPANRPFGIWMIPVLDQRCKSGIRLCFLNLGPGGNPGRP